MKSLMMIAMVVTTIFINAVGCVNTQSQFMPAVREGNTEAAINVLLIMRGMSDDARQHPKS